MKRNNFNFKKSFFTLIELLVVVAIFGILASILMPSLSNARQKGYKAVCTSNMKQIGILFNLYQSSNDEYFPVASTSDTRISWDDLLSDFDGRNLTQDEKEEWHLTNTSNVEVYQCPGTIQQRTGDLALMTYAVNSTRVHDISNSNAIRGSTGYAGSGDGWSVRVGNIVEPEESMALLEAHTFSNIMGHTTAEGYINLGHFTWRFAPAFPERFHSDQIGGTEGFYIHGPKKHQLNYLFSDGHVSFKTAQSALGEAYPNFVSGTHNSSDASGTAWNVLD